MKRDYETTDTYDTIDINNAETFVNRYQPKENKSSCCASLTPALLARFILRTIIPIAFGLGTGMLGNWLERKIDMHNSQTLIELSDFAASFVTLLTAYTTDALLNCCWPTNPYRSNDFFQNTNSNDPNEIPLTTKFSM